MTRTDLTRLASAFRTAVRPRILVFVVFFACYLAAVVDLRLVFEARDELFLWNPRFLTDFLGDPGALVKWGDSLLVQMCYWGWPGVIAFTVLAWLLLTCTAGFMNATAGAEVGGTWIVPGILLMALFGDYFLSKSTVLGVGLAMLVANGWVRTPLRRLWLRWVLFTVISVALYYVAGTAWYVFAACCVIHEGVARRQWLSAGLLVLAGVGVKFGLDAVLARYVVASRNFHLPRLDEFRQSPLGWQNGLFCGYFPACAALVALRQPIIRAAASCWKRLRRPTGGKGSAGTGKSQKRRQVGLTQSRAPAGIPAQVRWAIGTGLVMAAAAVAGWRGMDWKVKAFLEIDYCAEHRQWDELLAKAKRLRYYTRFTNHDVNLALYHSGRLPNEMFSYPQQFDILLDQNQVSGTAIAMLRKPCSLLLELGRVNEAEHAGLELLEMSPTGRTLKRLAVVKMIKCQPAAARLFLSVLRDDLVLGRWADETLRRLEVDPDLAGDAEVQRLRRSMVPEDDLNLTCTIAGEGDIQLSYPRMLLNLLQHDDRNRMAFEYLMAMHLLGRNVAAAVELFPFLDRMGYAGLPSHYEEAALIFGANHPQDLVSNAEGVFFRGRKISETALGKYRRLQTIVNRAGGSIERAAPDLARELEGSYFTYYLTHAGRPQQ